MSVFAFFFILGVVNVAVGYWLGVLLIQFVATEEMSRGQAEPAAMRRSLPCAMTSTAGHNEPPATAAPDLPAAPRAAPADSTAYPSPDARKAAAGRCGNDAADDLLAKIKATMHAVSQLRQVAARDAQRPAEHAPLAIAVKAALDEWTTVHREPAQALIDLLKAKSCYHDQAVRVENLLLDQAAQVETTLSNLRLIETQELKDEAGSRLAQEINQLDHCFDKLHQDLERVLALVRERSPV